MIGVCPTFSYSCLLNLGCPREVMTGLGWARGCGGGLRRGGGGGGSLSLIRSRSSATTAPVASQPTLRGQSHVWSSWLEYFKIGDVNIYRHREQTKHRVNWHLQRQRKCKCVRLLKICLSVPWITAFYSCEGKLLLVPGSIVVWMEYISTLRVTNFIIKSREKTTWEFSILFLK